MTTDHLTDQDRQAVRDFLRDWGYASLEDWALDGDNDYWQHSASDEWYDREWHAWLRPVDLEAECFRFIERQGELQDEARYG